MNNAVTRRKETDRLLTMKKLKRTSYIMIMLIVFQSFSAVANSLDFHAIDTEHLQHDHDHAEHSINASVSPEIDISEDDAKVQFLVEFSYFREKVLKFMKIR